VVLLWCGQLGHALIKVVDQRRAPGATNYSQRPGIVGQTGKSLNGPRARRQVSFARPDGGREEPPENIVTKQTTLGDSKRFPRPNQETMGKM
jgi:hypothetical protein